MCLVSDRESWLVHSLVDYYYTSHSRSIISIITELREPHDKVPVLTFYAQNFEEVEGGIFLLFACLFVTLFLSTGFDNYSESSLQP